VSENRFRLRHKVRATSRSRIGRMHPWLAQYRTMAVVLMYRLISLIGPHCPASTYSSTWPSLRMHFAVHARKKEAGRKRGRGAKGISYAVYVHGHRVAARQSVHYLRNICLVIRDNTVRLKFVRSLASFIQQLQLQCSVYLSSFLPLLSHSAIN